MTSTKDVNESRRRQARGKGIRIIDHHSVEQMEQTKRAAVEDVGPDEYSAGTQNSPNFSQQPVLQQSGGT
jgi:hypothetical protein